MCIIALKPEKVLLTKAQMKIMWDQNPHGAGFMYAEGGEVKIVKGLTTLDALVKAIEEVGPLRKLVIHFRIRTHGAISEEMTHPFWVREGKLAMVHNGVIRPLTHLTTDIESDTAVFARKLSENYSDPILAVKNAFHRDMLETYIGHSKMVFMDGKGQTWILNEHLGEWSKNVWYSNTKYKLPLPAVKEPESLSYRTWLQKTGAQVGIASSSSSKENSFPGHFTSAPKAVAVARTAASMATIAAKAAKAEKPPTRKEIRAAKAAEKAAEKLAKETKLVPKTEVDLNLNLDLDSRIPPMTN